MVKKKDSRNSSSDPRETMIRTLRQLPFNTYQVAMYMLLQRLGFRHVRFLSREHLRGRTDGITGDFEVCWPAPFGTPKIMVALKQEARAAPTTVCRRDERQDALFRFFRRTADHKRFGLGCRQKRRPFLPRTTGNDCRWHCIGLANDCKRTRYCRWHIS